MKAVIIFASALVVVLSESEEHTVWNVVRAFIASFVASIVVLLVWPVVLYKQKYEYFKFPDNEIMKSIRITFEKEGNT